jgi:tRNA pseudouridine38-40 synthase
MLDTPTPNTAPSTGLRIADPIRQRYKLTIAYDGSAFHGWQKQIPPDGQPLRTVQGVVEQTLRELLRQPLNLLGASRTDAGVHAEGQVAQFDAASPIPLDRLAHALNGRLPDDIEIRDVQLPSPTFEAIGGAVSKQYLYRLYNVDRRPLGIRHLVYHCWLKLDLDRMNDAAQRLVGEHDFAGFAAAGHNRVSTIREIHRCCVQAHAPEVHVIVEGSGFLYNMVRIIVGTLIEIGRGHWEPDRIDTILRHADRALAGPTAPPQGLCLQWVKYHE